MKSGKNMELQCLWSVHCFCGMGIRKEMSIVFFVFGFVYSYAANLIMLYYMHNNK